MQVPDINRHTQFRPFLVDFFQINKAANKNFSFRYFAHKLGWSASHLNDVPLGRRFLSLNKVLELIEFLGLKTVRAERLMLLALFESNGLGNRTQDFLSILDSSLNVTTMTQDESKVLTSMRVQQVMQYLISRNGVWNASDFIARTRNGHKISKDELENVLCDLEKSQMIRWNSDQKKYVIEKTEFYRDKDYKGDEIYSTIQREYGKNYQEFLEDRFTPWNDLFGMVQIPASQLSEVYERMGGLRNYLYSLRSKALEKSPNEELEVFQFSISLFSVFRRKPESKKD